MKNNSILIFAIILIITLSVSAAAYDTELKPFEEVLADYGVDESMVVGKYVLDESAEIPVYEFTYIYKEDWFGKFIGKFFKILRINVFTKDTKVPAVQMYVEDWEKHGQLLVIPFKSAWGEDKDIKMVVDYELDLSSYPLPAYKIKTNVIEPGPNGTSRNVVINKPAVEMKEKLFGVWNGNILLSDEECIEHSGRIVEISAETSRTSRIENPDLRDPYCDYPSERLIQPSLMSESKTYSGCCLPVDNYEALRHSGFQGIKT